jgi:UPF0176 protein
MKEEYQILLFYKYVFIENPEKERDAQRALCEKLGLKGRLILAKEGINVTLEGTKENTEKYIEEMKKDPRFSDIKFKRSPGIGDAFPRLSVKARKEIVSLHLEKDIDPNQITGKRLSADELKTWYEEGREFYVVDMRNDYEYKVGRFKDSILMPVQNFRDIPSSLSYINHLKDKTVIPVCTGGVRCEKASGLLVREGFKDVYQLQDGIVTFMEKYPATFFEGTLYVFDKRIIMDFDPEDRHKVVGKCDLCEAKTEKFLNCANKNCNRKMLCCIDCQSSGKEVFCSSECQDFYMKKKNE